MGRSTKVKASRKVLKEWLQEQGTWAEFLAERKEVAERKGFAPGKATELILDKYAPWALRGKTPPGPEGATEAEPTEKPADATSAGEQAGSDTDKVGSGARSTIREDIEWVYRHIDNQQLKPQDAPSPGAWGLRKWARQDGTNRAEFYKQFVVRLLPTRAQLEAEEHREDDGRDVIRTIEKLQKIGDTELQVGV